MIFHWLFYFCLEPVNPGRVVRQVGPISVTIYKPWPKTPQDPSGDSTSTALRWAHLHRERNGDSIQIRSALPLLGLSESAVAPMLFICLNSPFASPRGYVVSLQPLSVLEFRVLPTDLVLKSLIRCLRPMMDDSISCERLAGLLLSSSFHRHRTSSSAHTRTRIWTQSLARTYTASLVCGGDLRRSMMAAPFFRRWSVQSYEIWGHSRWFFVSFL